MPISGDQYEFSDDNIDKSPDKHGVYALFDGSELIYYGRADGKGVTIRSRLRDHKDGREGKCTEKATLYKREVTNDAADREVELLKEYKQRHKKLPRCNEVMPT
ncbi:MAG: hypothetical protein KGL39_42390 [Patescibacteria group bacterium]|nr:hypothetical protein [Patescibacteria group bacterium]